MKVTVEKIAEIVEGDVEGEATALISGPGKIEDALPGQLTFLGNAKYESHIYNTQATAVLVQQSFQPRQALSTTLIRVPDVYAALGQLLEVFDQGLPEPTSISSHATIDTSASVDPTARIGPYVTIQAGAQIEAGVVIDGHNFIGSNSIIGAYTRLYPGVRVMHHCTLGSSCIIHSNTVIGSDGFGFSQNEEGHFNKIKQTGGVLIGDEVEIGANCAIDRGSIGDTQIETGAKLDNLIQIAHNVTIGPHTVIAAQAGVAGSTKIGAQCMIGGQVGVVGHLKIKDRTQIQAQSGVASSTKEAGEKLYGTPAISYPNYLRSYAVFRNLPDHLKRIQDLERELDKLKSKFRP
jgi:UDP-3-O-[3-hydroxymyristoyl] glucosamine N-acyltransferase